MAVETDAGIILQASEIIRVVLEPEGLNESNNPMNNGSNNANGGNIPGPSTDGLLHGSNTGSDGHFRTGDDDDGDHPGSGYGGNESAGERNSFLQIFFEFYVAWLVAPFQYRIEISWFAPPLFGGLGGRQPTVVTTVAVGIWG